MRLNPSKIANTTCIRHLADNLPPETKRAILYEGKSPKDEDCDLMAAWDSPWDTGNPGNYLLIMIFAVI